MRATVEYHDYVKEGFGSLQFEHPAYEPDFYEKSRYLSNASFL